MSEILDLDKIVKKAKKKADENPFEWRAYYEIIVELRDELHPNTKRLDQTVEALINVMKSHELQPTTGDYSAVQALCFSHKFNKEPFATCEQKAAKLAYDFKKRIAPNVPLVDIIDHTTALFLAHR